MRKMSCCVVYNLTGIIDYVNLITLSIEKEIKISKVLKNYEIPVTLVLSMVSCLCTNLCIMFITFAN